MSTDNLKKICADIQTYDSAYEHMACLVGKSVSSVRAIAEKNNISDTKMFLTMKSLPYYHETHALGQKANDHAFGTRLMYKQDMNRIAKLRPGAMASRLHLNTATRFFPHLTHQKGTTYTKLAASLST